jgi:hypothetical protein
LDPRGGAGARCEACSSKYADLTDLMLVLDMKLGGGLVDAVNEGQRLVRASV